MKYSFLFIILLFISTKAYTAHLVGGEMTYVCNGIVGMNNDSLSITVNITSYRDCFFGVNFENDTIRRFVIYSEKEGNYEKVGFTQEAILVDTTILENPYYPCLFVPNNVCVEKADYSLDIIIPIRLEKYIIVHQNGFRNISITNITRPDSTGTTHFIELDYNAQQTCNSSPIFENIPPSIICVNEVFIYEPAVIDLEGDSLVYSLCTPLSIYDDPPSGILCNQLFTACPPPYIPVQFINPPYSAQYPFGITSSITVDSQTGSTRIFPTIQGQFIASICVEEFRNGVSLGSISRDFQFNIGSCQRRFNSAIQDLETDYLNCEESLIFLENTSFPSQEISSFKWTVEGDDFYYSSNIKDLTLDLPIEGDYDIQLFITGLDTTCVDTLSTNTRYVEDIPVANFSCEPTSINSLDPTIQLMDLSSNAFQWAWYVEDEKITSLASSAYTFRDTGLQTVTLIIEDEFGCNDTISKIIDVVPEVTYFLPNAFTPNGDGINDFFKGIGIIDGIEDFSLSVWDRWGQKIFETTNITQGWDGSYKNNGKLLNSGVYFYRGTYQKPRGEIIDLKGAVSLLN